MGWVIGIVRRKDVIVNQSVGVLTCDMNGFGLFMGVEGGSVGVDECHLCFSKTVGVAVVATTAMKPICSVIDEALVAFVARAEERFGSLDVIVLQRLQELTCG